jgi:predicted nucleic acid-binding protein
VIVVDVNVLSYSLIEGRRTQEALALRAVDPDWRLPPVWKHEFANVLVNYARRGGMSEARATALSRGAVASYGPREVSPDYERVLETALKKGLSSYDAEYLVLAEELGCPCVTEDRAVRLSSPGKSMSMQEYLAKHG